ncbi:putative oxidoreductase [Colletotrichum spinosum]|uniref:Putative oxidoreductase n=1 Tax=Colletotrichum spinosum TaxID=1347390 RepID=A0A4R8QGD0_9PEZI|nr:putative oxidoreductase [Colletotrichum spinosum]
MQSLRNIYTQWWPPSPTFTETEVPYQVGRVFMVTGSDSGIGFELCKMLHTTGATVYMASLSRDLAEKAIDRITSAVPSPANPVTLKPLELDLADFESVKAAVAAFSSQESHLDVLWNNAGVGSGVLPASYRTAQGLNGIIGINAVGPLLLTTLLLPQLQEAASRSASESNDYASGIQENARRNPGRVRVVWTSSNLVDLSAPEGEIDMEAIRNGGSESPNINYAMSKCANWAFAAEMARRYSHGTEGIVAVAQNPGNLNTGAFKGTPAFYMTVLNALKILSGPKSGAYTELFAGLSPVVAEAGSGAYVIPWGRIMPEESMTRQDIVKAFKPVDEGGGGLSQEFWQWCESQWKGSMA